MENRVAVLDCTIRDGGLGLQFECDDPKVKKLYSICDIVEMAKCLTEADIDIIELGTLAAMDSDMPEFGIFRTMESISELIPSNRGENQIFSVFFPVSVPLSGGMQLFQYQGFISADHT